MKDGKIKQQASIPCMASIIFRNRAENSVVDVGKIQFYMTQKGQDLTGQNLSKTMISPLESTYPLDNKHSRTIDLAGNHDLT